MTWPNTWKRHGDGPSLPFDRGVHLHHLRCPDEAAYQRVCAALDKLGLLVYPRAAKQGITNPTQTITIVRTPVKTGSTDYFFVLQ